VRTVRKWNRLAKYLINLVEFFALLLSKNEQQQLSRLSFQFQVKQGEMRVMFEHKITAIVGFLSIIVTVGLMIGHAV